MAAYQQQHYEQQEGGDERGQGGELMEEDDLQQQTVYSKIEELENYGINKADITKLKLAGYHTIESVNTIIFFYL